jgi:type VI secretion system Hcp family effector
VYKLAPDTIEVLEVRHFVSHAYNAGAIDGDRKHAPFVIIKAVDMTSPTLNKICCDRESCPTGTTFSGERILDMTLQYFIQDGQSPDPAPALTTWKLTDAYIVSVKPTPARTLNEEINESYDLLEEVSFSYQHIEWHHYAHRAPNGVKDLPDIIQVDSWSSLAG